MFSENCKPFSRNFLYFFKPLLAARLTEFTNKNGTCGGGNKWKLKRHLREKVDVFLRVERGIFSDRFGAFGTQNANVYPHIEQAQPCPQSPKTSKPHSVNLTISNVSRPFLPALYLSKTIHFDQFPYSTATHPASAHPYIYIYSL